MIFILKPLETDPEFKDLYFEHCASYAKLQRFYRVMEALIVVVQQIQVWTARGLYIWGDVIVEIITVI